MRTTKHVSKPWGNEEIWAQTSDYVGKILYINRNSKLSLQYHQQKEETIRVLRGRLYLHYGENKDNLQILEMVEGDTYHVLPNHIHRFEARDEAVELVEVSTNHLHDVVRIEDDYSRVREKSSDFPSV
jgi:mannose-6-phosphate isomerase-like protein (cupin superfamily)